MFCIRGLRNDFERDIDASYSKLVLYTLVQTSFKSADYDLYKRLYSLLINEPYMKYKVGSSLLSISLWLYLLYMLSMYPRLFYVSMKTLKHLGVHMY